MISRGSPKTPNECAQRMIRSKPPNLLTGDVPLMLDCKFHVTPDSSFIQFSEAGHKLETGVFGQVMSVKGSRSGSKYEHLLSPVQSSSSPICNWATPIEPTTNTNRVSRQRRIGLRFSSNRKLGMLSGKSCRIGGLKIHQHDFMHFRSCEIPGVTDPRRNSLTPWIARSHNSLRLISGTKEGIYYSCKESEPH